VKVLVCVKRVPAVAGKISLTGDGREIDTRHLAFTVSPHEECAAEEAVRLVAAHGGESTVLTLGPEAATDQLRDMMAIGMDRAILLETDGREWDPRATAAAIVEAVRAREAEGGPFDLLLFGNEAADTGDYQVGIRVAHALDRPCVTGVKALEVRDGRVTARREAAGGWELFEAPLPAVLTVKEGLNLPRYPSLPGRLKAKKKPIERLRPEPRDGGLEMVRLRAPAERGTRVEVLGRGADAAPRAVALLRSLGLLPA
jgi:electron transfer flavoprotein beta subunit